MQSGVALRSRASDVSHTFDKRALSRNLRRDGSFEKKPVNVPSMNKAATLETIASFATDSAYYGEFGFMKTEQAEEVAEILWHREHETRLDMFLGGSLGQAIRAYTAQEWAYDPCEAQRRDAWIAFLREKLPQTMATLEA